MPNEDTGLQNTQSSNDLSKRDLAANEEAPQRRYTEGSTFRETLRRDADVITNIYLDIPHPIRRSLSEDFQDSFEFANLNPEMAFSGGTNSLPAFLSGSSSGQHSALLQQMQSSHRAVENDYCEQPPPCHFIQAQTRASSRNSRTNTDLARHTRRQRQQHREPSGRRLQTRSSSRQRGSREEGAHPAFRDGLVTTSADRYTTSNNHRRDIRFDEPPPRPPLSTYHIEHRYAERELRVTASLPASLSFNSGEGSLVPMRYNALPSRHHHHSSRHRTTNPSRQFVMGTQRGYSLTPPPVCRANKPRYDAHNRLIQTVSSPSVVTQCIDSSMSNLLQSHGHRSIVRPTPRVAQPLPRNVEKSIEEIKKENSLSQPTHVVISQPKRKSKKKQRQEELENDEIAQEKRSLVVSLNNNIPKNSKSTTTKKSKNASSKKNNSSSKLIDKEPTKKEECAPMLPAKDSRQETEELSSTTLPLKAGEPCPRCGKCGEESQGRKSDADISSSTTCNQRCCVCSVDTCVETATCLCCAKAVFYHCLSHEDEDTFADKPCSCHSEKCCLRWTLLGMLSFCFPCLCCYPVARGCVKLCRSCSKRSKSRNESYR